MKISLVFPNRNIGRKKKLDAVTPPLGLAYLAAILEKNNFKINIIDCYAENLGFDDLKKIINEIKPDVVGITTNVDIIYHSLLTAKIIKEILPNTIILLGGPQATSTYKYLLKYNFIDYIVLGEGEYTTLELLQKIKNNESVETVKGIAFRKNNKIIRTQDRGFIENLDELPFPAWHFFPNLKKYKYFTLTNRPLPILTTRGCPYKCIYCTKCIHGYKVRYRSPENIVDEIKHCIKKYKVKEFGIADDHFTFDAKRTIKLCDLIIKSKLKIKMTLSNGIRVDTISKKLVNKLYSAGCWFIAIGIESGNQQVLNKIGKEIKLEQITKSIKIIKQKNIIVAGYFIIGLPYDNLKTIKDTIKFAKNSDLDLAIFNLGIPFPGTKMFNLIEKYGRFTFPSKVKFLRGMNTQYEGPYFEIWNLKKEDVIKSHKKAYKEFYFRPAKIISLMSKIHSSRQIKYILNYFKNMFLS